MTTAADEPTIAPAPPTPALWTPPVEYPEPCDRWVAEQALSLLAALDGATDAAEYEPFRISFAVGVVRQTFREAVDQRARATTTTIGS